MVKEVLEILLEWILVIMAVGSVGLLVSFIFYGRIEKILEYKN